MTGPAAGRAAEAGDSGSPGARLSVRGLGKSFGPTAAVDAVDLEVGGGSLTALLGPSGCGKSTLLAMIGGLLDPDRGTVELDGSDVTGVPAERRGIGLVFQRPLLFPHLTVAQNVAFGLRMRRVPRRSRAAKVAEILDRVQLGALTTRRVGELSGGQEQRAALARALVLEPRVLLLDEPFSQLDAQLRAEMRTLVRGLVRETRTTTVFVTHDQAEAVEVADDIVLMLDGRVAGHGDAEAFFVRPPSLAAARFFGAVNEIAGQVRDGWFTTPDVAGGVSTELSDGPAVVVARPEALRLGRPVGDRAVRSDGAEDGLVATGVVTGAHFAGTHVVVDVDVTRRAAGVWRVHVPVGEPVAPGTRVEVRVPGRACTVFPCS